ncbi:MAG TPA: MFS transporter [Candidatus Limnocylindrales bacterium]|nr:MFS transporter [Candidatus Limnocylindrales bacterium]
MTPSPRRWLMITLVFWATVINYLDRQTLSVAAPVLRDQFHLSNTDYSRILFAFLLAYTIMNGLSGPIIDRLGTRIGYAACMAWWSAAALLHGLARGPLSLGAFRFLLGIGEAGNWPAGVKVVGEWFPEKERALASGFFNSGSAVGAILAPPIVAYVLLHLGWQAAFVMVGAAGFLWLAVWMPVYRTPREIAGKSAPEPEPLMPMRVLVRTRFVAAFTFSKIFMDPVWYFYIFWFPEYLKRVRHFDMASIGLYGWIPFLVAGFGNLFGGLLSGFLLQRGASLTVARKLSVTFFAALMTSAIPAVLTPSAWLSIAFVSIAMMGYTGCVANMLAMPADVLPANRAGSAYGIASMGSGFGGMVFTLITGWAVDHYSYTPVFIGFGILPLICATILWTLLGPLTPRSKSRTSSTTSPEPEL